MHSFIQQYLFNVLLYTKYYTKAQAAMVNQKDKTCFKTDWFYHKLIIFFNK